MRRWACASRDRPGVTEDSASLRTDGELVAAALRDKSAYAQIVRRWEPILSRYVGRLIGRGQTVAEDVLQEVFIKVYLNLNDYDRSRPFGPWIYRIARNETFDFLRKRKAEPAFVTGEDASLIFERLGDPSDRQENREWIRIEESVRNAIAALDLRYREVLVLRYLEDKGYDEISDILRIPPGTVATLIRRGTQKLRNALEFARSRRCILGVLVTDLERRVLEEIDRRGIAPRPYAYFLAKRSVFWALAGLSVLLGAISVAVAIYGVWDLVAAGGKNFDEMPFDDLFETLPFVWAASSPSLLQAPISDYARLRGTTAIRGPASSPSRSRPPLRSAVSSLCSKSAN